MARVSARENFWKASPTFGHLRKLISYVANFSDYSLVHSAVPYVFGGELGLE